MSLQNDVRTAVGPSLTTSASLLPTITYACDVLKRL